MPASLELRPPTPSQSTTLPPAYEPGSSASATNGCGRQGPGIRPEHREIGREAGTISHVEHLGGETNVHVSTARHGLTVRRFGEHRYTVDESVHLTPDPARQFHFDANGRRLAA